MRTLLVLFLLSSSFVYAQAPAISSFSPAAGNVGTTVTISGSGFSATPANNTVYFGATRASVITASTSSLTVTVPTGATYDYVSVETNAGLIAKSPLKFNPTFACPGGNQSFGNFTSYTPKAGKVIMADIDGDGKDDLIQSNDSTGPLARTITIRRNTSTAGSLSFAANVNVVVEYQPGGIDFGDLDGDGKPDLVVMCAYNGYITVLRNLSTPGTISFAPYYSLYSNFAAVNVSVADLDLDGKLDLVVSRSRASATYLITHLNASTTGSFSFGAAQTIYTGSTIIQDVKLGDIDGDGKTDIVTADQYGGRLFTNTSTTGSISFGTPVSLLTTVYNDIRQIQVADLDLDGKLDIAYPLVTAQAITILRNTSSPGSPSFATAFNHNVSDYYGQQALVVSDYNGDGKPDIASAGSSVHFIKNNSTIGTFSFTEQASISGSNLCLSMAAGDLNFDNKPDIAISNYYDVMKVALNTHTGTTNTWTGVTNNLWNTASNWDCGIVPVSNSTVIIPDVTNDPLLEGTNGACGIITLNANSSLTINNTGFTAYTGITNNGSVTTLGTGSIMQPVGSTLTGTGTYTINRAGTTSPTKYNYWSSPITSGTLPGSNGYRYNAATGTHTFTDDNPGPDPGWVAFSGTMAVGKGYASTGGGAVAFTGTINNGNITAAVTTSALPMSSTSGPSKFNLIGNPYPSGISANAFRSTNSSLITANLYFWDDDNSGGANYTYQDYAIWNGSGSIGGGGNTPTGTIASGQGFMVEAIANGNVSFTNNHRTTQNNQFFKTEDEEPNKFWLSVANDSLYNEILIAFNTLATEGRDLDYDAYKRRGNPRLALSAENENEQFGILTFQPLSNERIVPLNLFVAQNETMTFANARNEQMDNIGVTLLDSVTHTRINITAQDYTTYISAGENKGRFYLVFNADQTGIAATEMHPAITAYTSGNELVMLLSNITETTGNIVLTDIAGRQVFMQQGVNLQNNYFKTDVATLATGIYVVSLQTATSNHSTKIVIR